MIPSCFLCYNLIVLNFACVWLFFPLFCLHVSNYRYQTLTLFFVFVFVSVCLYSNTFSSYWYENRHLNVTCPQTPLGLGADCDWAMMVPCLFGDMTIAPKTIFVHSLMLPVRLFSFTFLFLFFIFYSWLLL